MCAISYLGSYSDRLWNKKSINPGVYLGLGPCMINGVAYPVCSTNANLNNRRVLYLERPLEAQYIGPMDQFVDVGTKTYRGLKFSFRRRSAAGVSLNGNYTLSRCFGLEMNSGGGGFDEGYLKPDDPRFRPRALRRRPDASRRTRRSATRRRSSRARRCVRSPRTGACRGS